MPEFLRAHVIISGRVQGVFFRMETMEEANRSGVSGWVKNRHDGTVEAVFEGDKNSVESMLQWCKKGPPASKVDNVQLTWEPYAGEFKKFEIRF